MITKENVEKIISEFEIKKDSIFIKKENLVNFNLNKKEDTEYYSFINGVSGYYLKFLKYLVENIKPKNIVELGNREGLSTLCIYDGIKKYDANFYSIDIDKDQRYCPNNMFKDKKMNFLYGDVCSEGIIKQLPRKIDFLFSDTIHYDFQLRDEFAIYQHLLADKALVAIDDINLNDKRKLFDEISYPKWDLTKLCHVSGWGLFLYERKNILSDEERALEVYRASASVWQRKYETNERILQKLKKRKLKNVIKKYIKKIKPLYKLIIFLKNI